MKELGFVGVFSFHLHSIHVYGVDLPSTIVNAIHSIHSLYFVYIGTSEHNTL